MELYLEKNGPENVKWIRHQPGTSFHLEKFAGRIISGGVIIPMFMAFAIHIVFSYLDKQTQVREPEDGGGNSRSSGTLFVQ